MAIGTIRGQSRHTTSLRKSLHCRRCTTETIGNYSDTLFDSQQWFQSGVRHTVCRQALVREVTGSNSGTSKILGGDGLPYRIGDGLPGTVDRS